MADKLVAKTQLNYFKTKLDEEFVAKESGKVLSTNDFTNEYKTKLDGIAVGANKTVVDDALNKESTNPVQNKVIATKLEEITSQGGEPNTIETIKVNGSPLEPDGSKAVDISVPTKVSQLQNDSGYQTAANVEQTLTSKNYATKSDISSVYKAKGSVETYAGPQRARAAPIRQAFHVVQEQSCESHVRPDERIHRIVRHERTTFLRFPYHLDLERFLLVAK